MPNSGRRDIYRIFDFCRFNPRGFLLKDGTRDARASGKIIHAGKE